MKLFIPLPILLCFQHLSAHPGDLDAGYGHNDYSNGTYHYHTPQYQAPPAPNLAQQAALNVGGVKHTINTQEAISRYMHSAQIAEARRLHEARIRMQTMRDMEKLKNQRPTQETVSVFKRPEYLDDEVYYCEVKAIKVYKAGTLCHIRWLRTFDNNDKTFYPTEEYKAMIINQKIKIGAKLALKLTLSHNKKIIVGTKAENVVFCNFLDVTN